MEWLKNINKAIKFIEENITEKISIEDVSNHVFISSSHFQRIFNILTGITVGEYIRNRRLSLAAKDLLINECKIIDIAMKYQYDTQESFSKAFSRFHNVNPSDVKNKKNLLKFYYPITVNISIQGGYNMSHKLIDEFYWNDISKHDNEDLNDAEKYQAIVNWAGKARGKNPKVFDLLTEWILDDSQWNSQQLIENEQILIHGVFARFKEQNNQLRTFLKEIKSSEIVNEAVYKALDYFDNALCGKTHVEYFQEVVSKMFNDFSLMKDHKLREQIAGGKTGPTGTDSVEIFGYINLLKDCDATVQWALFMPSTVEKQQNGFKIDSFECKNMPAMRFIGFKGEEYENVKKRLEKFKIIDSLEEYKSTIQYDILFMHHNGLGVDIEPCDCIWGRFMKPNTPVPEGFVYLDFIPNANQTPKGQPYISQYTYATFSGDYEKMHTKEGFDCDAMYDITRNIMLAQGINIPYPQKYWTAEVFINGCDKYSTGYMFSAEF